MRLKLRQLIFLILFISINPVNGQNINKVVDSLANTHFADSTMTGLAIGVINKGEKQEYYYGGKYTSLIEDVDSSTIFELGSVTKTYTSFLLASLEHEGKVSRNDYLAKYLPDSITHKKSWANKIKLVHLATHSAGLDGFDSTKKLEKYKEFDPESPFSIFTKDFMMRQLMSLEDVENFGMVKYSNFGVGLLGLALQEASSMDYQELLNQYIINPLNLHSTYSVLPERQTNNMAIPHQGKDVVPLIQLSDLKSAGSIKATLPDVMSYLEIYLNASDLNSVVESMLRPQAIQADQEMALAWMMYEINGEPIFFHTGGTYGSSSIVLLVPSKKSTLTILSNNQQNGALTNYALKIADLLTK